MEVVKTSFCGSIRTLCRKKVSEFFQFFNLLLILSEQFLAQCLYFLGRILKNAFYVYMRILLTKNSFPEKKEFGFLNFLLLRQKIPLFVKSDQAEFWKLQSTCPTAHFDGKTFFWSFYSFFSSLSHFEPKIFIFCWIFPGGLSKLHSRCS